jgi:hypothetical protein
VIGRDCRCPGCGQCEAAAALDTRSHEAGVYARRMEQAQKARRKAIAERDEARAEVERLRARIASMQESMMMSCEEPPTGCQCAGCSYAREKGGAS